MLLKQRTIVMALAAMIMAPGTALAFGGGAGCADLPDYDRAQGALEGMPGACDMTIERARQIVAAQDGPAAVSRPVAPAPHSHRRHRQRVQPQ